MDDINNTFSIIVFSIFASAAAIQLFYYLFFYISVHVFRPVPAGNAKKPVSVIICARNEDENLNCFLTSVLEQDYPDYEVIVVNDCSEDNSFEVLGS